MDIPRFDASSFVGDWRSLAFRSQVEAAHYFALGHTTVSRYESGKLTPPLGYLACLARLIAQRIEQDDATAATQGRQSLMVELNHAIRSWYPEINSFKTWHEVRRVAGDYLASRPNHPAEASPQPSSAPAPPPRMAPPLPAQGIFGREADLERIWSLLQPVASQTADGYRVALRGMGGVGKTTLAMAVGRRENILELFPDGVLWAALGPRPAIRTLLNHLGHALGVDLQALPDEAACQVRLRAHLYKRRALLIVDDIWQAQQGGAFALGGPHCGLLVTTREVPIANELATSDRTLRVGLLQPEAALGLVHRLAPQAVAADEQNARRLCERLEFLPLALTLAGRLLANEADVPGRLEWLIQELLEHRAARLQLLQAEGRLGLDTEEPVSLQAILGMSVDRLDSSDQDRFAMLSPFGGEPYTWEITAVADVWECALDQAEATVARFIQRGLVERRGDRYWMHTLLADFAEEMRGKRGV